MPDSNEAAAAKIAEDRRKAREAAQKSAEESLDKQAKEDAVKTAETMRRMNESRPTPTQRENDLARLGYPVLEKEHDGSGPDPASLSPEERARLESEKKTSEASGSAPYRTREATAPKPAVKPA